MNRTQYKTIADEIINRQDIIDFLNSTKDIAEIFKLTNTLNEERIELYKRLYEGIGNTPVYQVQLPNNNSLHIKAEYFNAMGNNHYSRCWIPYLFIAEILGVIIPKVTHIIEVTSGNAGIALAIACNKLGYPLTLVVPDFLPNGRLDPMVEHGANVIKVNGYIDKCIGIMRRMLVSGNYFPCNHSEEEADVLVKIDKRIASEYIKEFGCPDYAIVGLGNGTSTFALFEQFKKENAETKTITFHPDPQKEDVVFGLFRPIFNLRHIEPALKLTNELKYTSGMDLDSVKNLFIFDTEICNFGYSSLYAIHIAMEVASMVKNKTFFTIAYDKIDRYR